MPKKSNIFSLFLVMLMLLTTIGCQQRDNYLVVYTSVDRIYSEPIFQSFEKETGIQLLPVYDVEASKTTGLYHRLIAEKDNPKADVFWNGEILYTLKLDEAHMLHSYDSPNNKDLPSEFIDPDFHWTAFGGRARVIIINTDLVAQESYPQSLNDFIYDSIPQGEKAIAKPLFGTTSTHMTALYSYWGHEKGAAFFRSLAESDLHFVDGNGAVRDLVASGKLAYGLTDTDDALGATEKNLPVAIVFPDQGDSDPGTLIIPNSISIINGAKHMDQARTFVDYMLSDQTMIQLIESNWCQVTMRQLEAKYSLDMPNLKIIPVTFTDIEENAADANEILIELFNQ